MQLSVLIVLILSLTDIASSQTDPCDSYQAFPDADRRDAAYTLSSGEDAINDREITEGWYGDPKLILLDKAPGFFRCGTWYPIWAKETNGGRLTMCLQSRSTDCAEEFEIEMVKCDATKVYYLSQASVHKAAYCLEIDPDAPPLFNEKPTIAVDLMHEELKSKLLFQCHVTRSSEDLFYKTIWYVNGAPIYSFESVKWTDDSFDYVTNTTLTEDLLIGNNVTKAGFNLQCAVRAQYRLDSSFSKSELSDNQFVGVEIDDKYMNYTMNEGDTREVYVSLSVPFGCGRFFLDHDQACEFHVEIASLDDPDDCTSALVAKGTCGIEPISAATWNQRSSVTFVGKITSVLKKASTTARLMLKTTDFNEDLSPLSSLWKDYNIGHVTFQVLKDDSVTQSKYCASLNDPHVYTFDRKSFYLHEAGFYTMYEDKSRSIEIQIQTEECGSYNLDGPFCTCGLAVRAGKTVFEISHCESLTWHIGYTACDNGGDVINVRRQGGLYVIQLPTGNTVNADVKYYDPWYVNVQIYPTIQDKGKSRGLCGKLSNTKSDDLVMRNNDNTNSVDDFAESWRVKDEDNLFDPEVVKNDWDLFKPLYQYCTCSKNREIECSVKAASEVCKTHDNFEDVKPKDCALSRRKKRMALKAPRKSQRVKRQVTSDETWFNGWNESSATAYCDSKFAESSSVQMLQNVPGINATVASRKKDCVQDIKHSGTTDFTAMAVAGVRMSALHEAMVNPVLTEPDPNNPSASTMFDMITSQTCQGDCNGRGSCSKGQCQCDTGYGGASCSIDVTVPPIVYDAGDGGHCDLVNGDCTSLAVIGQIFSGDKDSRCRIEKSMIQSTGGTETIFSAWSAAVAESISEVECTLPEPVADDVVIIYNISVSHAGDVYSNQLTVLVYDSLCVNVNHETWTWTLQDGYCIHKGKCLAIGDTRGVDPCWKCEYVNGAPSWVQTSDDCSSKPSGDAHSDRTTSPVTVAFLAIAAAVILE